MEADNGAKGVLLHDASFWYYHSRTILYNNYKYIHTQYTPHGESIADDLMKNPIQKGVFSVVVVPCASLCVSEGAGDT